MSQGIRWYNDNVSLLISDATYNMQFIGKATLSSQEDGGNCNVVSISGYRPFWFLYYTISAPSNAPIVSFITLPVGTNRYAGVFGNYYLGSGQWRVIVTFHAPNMSCASPGTPIPEVYCFSQFITSEETHGMQIFDAAGAMIFESSDKVLVLHQLADVAQPTSCGKDFNSNAGEYFCVNDGNTAIDSLPAKPAFAFPVTARLRADAGGNFYVYYAVMVSPSTATNLRARWCYVGGSQLLSSVPEFVYDAYSVRTPIIDAARYDF